MSPRRDLTESQAGPYRVPGGTLPSPRRDLTMISDERRYGDRIQAHMRWLSCTARECGPAAQRDMERWVASHVEHRRGPAGAPGSSRRLVSRSRCPVRSCVSGCEPREPAAAGPNKRRAASCRTS